MTKDICCTKYWPTACRLSPLKWQQVTLDFEIKIGKYDLSISSEQNFFWENSSLLFWLNIFCKKMMDTLLMCPFSKRLADIFPGLRFLWSSFNCCGLGKCNFQLVKVFITWSQGCRVLHHPAPDWIKNYMKFNKQLLSLMMLKLWETDSSEDSTSSCLAFSLPTSPSSWLRSSTVSASGGGILLRWKAIEFQQRVDLSF